MGKSCSGRFDLFCLCSVAMLPIQSDPPTKRPQTEHPYLAVLGLPAGEAVRLTLHRDVLVTVIPTLLCLDCQQERQCGWPSTGMYLWPWSLPCRAWTASRRDSAADPPPGCTCGRPAGCHTRSSRSASGARIYPPRLRSIEYYFSFIEIQIQSLNSSTSI